MSAYLNKLLAAGIPQEEATRYYVFDEQQRIENFERYAQQQGPSETYDDDLRDGYEMKYGSPHAA